MYANEWVAIVDLTDESFPHLNVQIERVSGQILWVWSEDLERLPAAGETRCTNQPPGYPLPLPEGSPK